MYYLRISKKIGLIAGALLSVVFLYFVAHGSSANAVWPEASGLDVRIDGNFRLDCSNIVDGYAMMSVATPSGNPMKVQVMYNGNQLLYDMKNTGEYEVLPLQFGPGAYSISLFENVAVTGYLYKERSAADTKKKAEELLERMGLSEVKSHIPSRVSGGEQQRCAIARAVINDPAIIFADEPTGALNRRNTKEVLDLLTELSESGQSIVMVTHDIKSAIHGNRILYLEDGNIVGELELSRYGEKNPAGEVVQDKKAREAQVNAWLESLDW